MKSRVISMFLIVLILMLPVALAVETSLVYDANGNLLTDGTVYRVYNALNQLVEIRNGTNATAPLLEDYFHHPVEERIFIKRLYNSTEDVIEKVIYHDKNFVTVINASGTFNFTYVYHEGVLVAQNTPSGKEFIHPDHKGSVNFVTNDAGTPIENTTFDGFGNIIAGGESTRFDYEGKEFSSVVGDYDFHARKYCVELGIFCQPDAGVQNPFDPQFFNRYTFVRNNPQKLIDPDGKTARVYFDSDALYGIGHLAVGVDAPNNPGQELFFENEGIGGNVEGALLHVFELNSDDQLERYIMSFQSKYPAKTSASRRQVYDKEGNVILPEGYEDYFEIVQDSTHDKKMIDKGLELTSKDWIYNARSHSSLHFGNEIATAGDKPLSDVWTSIPSRVFSVSREKYGGTTVTIWKKRIGQGGILTRIKIKDTSGKK